ncbi:hypothetical protein U1Q18_003066, partial [Sarracenia purpurea var. burkii]
MAMTTKKNTSLFLLFSVIAILVVGNVESAVSSILPTPILGLPPPPPTSSCNSLTTDLTATQCLLYSILKQQPTESCCASAKNLVQEGCWCPFTELADYITTWSGLAGDCGISVNSTGCGV